MPHLIVGQSDAIESDEAIRQATDQCLQGLAGRSPKAALLFTSILETDHRAMVGAVKDRFPETPLIGCTTAGEFSSVMGGTQASVLLALICSDTLSFQAHMGHRLSIDPKAAIRQALPETKKPAAPETFHLCLMDGIHRFQTPMNGPQHRPLFKTPRIFGGTSGDGLRFGQAFQFKNREVSSNAIVTLSITGPLLVGSGSAHGWQPIGRQGIITRVKNNVVYEINHKPAISFFHYYLDENSRQILHFPLAVYPPDRSGPQPDYFLRYGYRYNIDDGWITFSGQMPMDAIVRIAVPGRQQILSAAHTAIDNALTDYPGKNPTLAFCVSGAVRPQVLGSMRNAEFSAFLTGRKTPLPYFGFYSLCEVCPEPGQNTAVNQCNSFSALVLGKD